MIESIFLLLFLGVLGLGAWVIEGPLGQAWARRRAAMRSEDWCGEQGMRR